MVFITVKAGNKILYIEKQLLEAVLMRPAVQRVPGALDTILGVSWYEGELVVYYAAGTFVRGGCGLILKGPEGKLMGILADEADGEVEEDPSVMKLIVPGVWEKICD